MKKIIASVLVFISLISLFSCKKDITNDSFFDESALAERNLSGMPMPPVQSMVLEGNNTLYLYLTDEEYKNYARDVLEYLLAREDIYYLGYPYSWLADLWFFHYPILAPLDSNYDITLDSHTFMFSDSEELSASDDRISDPTRIMIERAQVTKKLSYTSFEYNTVIKIDTARTAKYDRCIKSHTYDEGIEYVIPGEDFGERILSCIYCGARSYAGDFGHGDRYNTTVVAGSEFLLEGISEHSYCGLLYKIKTGVVMDSDLKVTVNGTEIPKTHFDSDYWEYSFIAPCKDLEISVELTGERPDYPTYSYLDDYEVWLNDIEPDDILEIKDISEYVAVAPGNLKTVQRTVDQDVIARMLDSYKNLIMSPISKEDTMIDGGSAYTVEFLLKSGETKSLRFNNKNYVAGDDVYFNIKYIPSLTPYSNVTDSYSFVTYAQTFDLYTNEDDPKLLGEYSGLENLEFVTLSDSSKMGDAEYYILFDAGKIYIVSDTVFYVSRKPNSYEWYELADKQKFSDFGFEMAKNDN